MKLHPTIAAFLISCLLSGCGGGGGTSATLGPIVTSTEYSGNTQTLRYSDGSTATNTAISSPVTWASDHITKTTTHTFANGGTNPVVSVVGPTRSGGVLTTTSGINSTSAIKDSYGDGAIDILQEGTSNKPFLQTTLTGSNIADPNAIVTSATQAYDLRWGNKATPYTPSTADNVQSRWTATTATIQLTGVNYLYQPITTSLTLDTTIPLDMATSSMQGVWITPEVKNAWAEGWTGLGVKMGVIDDFTADNLSDFKKIPLPKGCGTVGSVTVCSSASNIYFQLTHGEQVSLIAGGSKSSFSGAIVESGGWSSSNDLGTYRYASDLNVAFTSPIFGVAKDAQMYRSDFLTYQSHTNGLFSVLKNWGVGTDVSSQRYRELKVLNLSLGGTSANPVTNSAIYSDQLVYAQASVTPDAVYVKAAGNRGCVISLTNCDPYNAVFYYATPYKDKSILVGALDQSNGTIASYSNRAGTFADRFLVADGRGIENFDGTYDRGTSFAAPRVAGYAAILRQKFPNLNASNTASVILDTASWNSGWGDKSTTTQAIYGQGEASLSRALAPVGRLR